MGMGVDTPEQPEAHPEPGVGGFSLGQGTGEMFLHRKFQNLKI